MLTRFFLSLVLLSTGIHIPSEENSYVKFKIKNFGITVEGSFIGLRGKIEFNPDRTDNAVNLTVDAKSIRTGIDLRDDHLRKEKYFDVKEYPTIQFTSTELTKVQNIWNTTWMLTLKKITKEISFPFTVERKGDAFVFAGEFTISRRDFAIGENSFSLSDDVIVKFKIATAPAKN